MIETSVIVPVYNVQEYIENTMRSILNNSYEDYELIVIDDGSTDDTLNIVQNLQQEDSRIVIFSQENQGVSAARNKGLDLAKGEYIAFIDGDDIVEPSYLQELVNMISSNNLDWVACAQKWYSAGSVEEFDIWKSFENDVILRGKQARTTAFDTTIVGSAKGLYNLPSVVMGIYRKNVIDQNMLRFDENIFYGEDMLFNLKISSCIGGFGYMSSPLYHVILHNDSSSAKMIKGCRRDVVKPLIAELDKIITDTRGGEWSERDLIYFWNRVAETLKVDVLAYKDRNLRRQAYNEYNNTFMNDDLIKRLFKKVGIRQAESLKNGVLILLIKTGSYRLIDFFFGIAKKKQIKNLHILIRIKRRITGN